MHRVISLIGFRSDSSTRTVSPGDALFLGVGGSPRAGRGLSTVGGLGGGAWCAGARVTVGVVVVAAVTRGSGQATWGGGSWTASKVFIHAVCQRQCSGRWTVM
jgi:hypothetical protein